MRIFNKINEHRERLKLTQQQLADALNVSRQTIIALEKGNYEPSLGLAMKLARYFDVDVEKLFMLK
ncbi:MAG: helix-turn-helix transcriptional regulator [Patescibacteria group bacterium]